MAIDLTKRSDKTEPITVLEHDQNLNDIENAINGLQGGTVNGVDVNQLRTDVDSNDTEIAQLQTDVAGNDTDIANLQADVTLNNAHRASTSNPHATTASQVGLPSVTNDAQLKREADDFISFDEKTTPVMLDKVLIEDETSGEKKYISLGNIPSTGASSEQDIYQDCLENSIYQSLTFDDFADETLVDDANTDATFDQNATGYTLAAAEQVQSEDLFDSNSGLGNVTECMVQLIYSDAGTPTIEVMADGTNWETVTPNTIHTFTNVGTTLKLRFTAGGTATLSSWAVFYNPDTSLATQTLGTMANEDESTWRGLLGGFRNKIINGNFDFDQRASSPYTSNEYTVDHWEAASSGSSHSVNRQSFTLGQTDVPGEPEFFLRDVVTSSAGANNYSYFQQKMEGVRTFAGQSVTLSVYAKADASKNIAVEFTQGFGTGGSPSTAVTAIGVTTLALTTAWQKFEVTVSIPAISGKTIGTDGNDYLQCRFWFDAGSTYDSQTNSLGQQSGTFDITQVQLEAGSKATTFEQRPLGVEFDLCQRYFQIFTWSAYSPIGIARSSSSGTVMEGNRIPFPVCMRTAPTATNKESSSQVKYIDVSDQTSQNGSAGAFTAITSETTWRGYESESGTNGYIYAMSTLSPTPTLWFDAEL